MIIVLAIFAIAVIVPLVMFGFVTRPLRQRRRLTRRLETEGRQATGVIMTIEETGSAVNKTPFCRITLEIEATDELTFLADVTQLVTPDEMVLMPPGTQVPVLYNPNDLEQIVVLDN